MSALMNNLIIDLETLSLDMNAVVWQIGVCPFGPGRIGDKDMVYAMSKALAQLGVQ